ncbi:hypothetical protein BJ138DRAFT_1141364, partial [Hygrophoropsis aurantiaca]
MSATDLKPYIEPIQAIIQRYPRFVSLAALASLVTPWLVGNYNAYIDMGPGGLPWNAYGWLIALYRKPFSRETKSTALYDKDANKTSYIKDPASIKERRGERPATTWHVFPSRQLNKFAPSDIQSRLIAIFDKHANANPSLVEVVPSRFERIHPAIVINSLKDSPHKAAIMAKREICHIHRGRDFSLHATMAPQDCKLVIERGWGERHPLAGSHFLPKEYVLLYAPRDDEELAVVEKLMCAAIGYMANTQAV